MVVPPKWLVYSGKSYQKWMMTGGTPFDGTPKICWHPGRGWNLCRRETHESSQWTRWTHDKRRYGGWSRNPNHQSIGGKHPIF